MVLAREQLLPPKTYLAGGTALALQLGHRRSNDFDFFTPTNFDVERAIEHLKQLPDFTLTRRAEGTVLGAIPSTQISLFRYQYPLIDATTDYVGIAIASDRDLAAMKLNAIADRGLRRDFVDVAALLDRHSLQEMLEAYDRKYQALAMNRVHLLKSLLYFFDADEEDHPDMLVAGLDWESVKAKLTAAVHAYKPPTI